MGKDSEKMLPSEVGGLYEAEQRAERWGKNHRLSLLQRKILPRKGVGGRAFRHGKKGQQQK